MTVEEQLVRRPNSGRSRGDACAPAIFNNVLDEQKFSRISSLSDICNKNAWALSTRASKMCEQNAPHYVNCEGLIVSKKFALTIVQKPLKWPL